MGNCLVTKLKGSVDNDELLKLGELKLHVDSVNIPITRNEQRILIVGSDYTPDGNINVRTKGSYMSLSSDLSSPTSSIDVPIGTEVRIYLLDGIYDVYVSNKYHIKVLGAGYEGGEEVPIWNLENIEDLYYTPNMTSLGIPNSTIIGDISKFPTRNIRYFTVYNTRLTGELSTSMEPLNLRIQGSSVSLDLNNFKLSLENQYYYAFNAYTRGDIVTFVSNQIERGLATKSNLVVKNLFLSGRVTFNGTPISNTTWNFGLTWESSSKIYVEDIDFKKIYAFGCSQQEISEWEQGGYTVQVIQ